MVASFLSHFFPCMPNPASGDAIRMRSVFDTFFPAPVSGEEKKDV